MKESITRKTDPEARESQATPRRDENVVNSEIVQAYKYLQDKGIDTTSINIDFEQNKFKFSGAVESEEKLNIVNEAISSSTIKNEVINNIQVS